MPNYRHSFVSGQGQCNIWYLVREEAKGSFESDVQSTWLVGLWEMYSRAPQINQKTEFWYFFNHRFLYERWATRTSFSKYPNTVLGRIWPIWARISARQIWLSGVSLKRVCKMQFRFVDHMSMGPPPVKSYDQISCLPDIPIVSELPNHSSAYSA